MASVIIRDIPDEVVSALKAQAEAEGLSREEYLRNHLIALAHRSQPGAENRRARRAQFAEASQAQRVQFIEAQERMNTLFESLLAEKGDTDT